MPITIECNTDSIRRRALMEKADIILSPIHNPEMLAVCYQNSLCSNENYMLKREAEKVSSIPYQTFRYKDSVLSLEEMRFFTKLSGASNTALAYCRNCKIILCPPNWTSIAADGIRRSNSLEFIVFGKKITSIGARNIYQLYESGYGVKDNRLTMVLLYPSGVVSLNSNNTNSASTVKDIYVPDDLVDSYKSTGTWSSTYASKIFGLSDLPSQYQKYVDYYN